MVALVRGIHGLHGAVRVEVLTDRPEARFVPGALLYREGSPVPLTLASAEAVQDGPGWRLRFREITTREAAETLRATYLETELRPDADLSRGEVYWHEVMGVAVRGLDGAELGVVKDIYRVAENEVYVVTGEPFGTFDVPAVRPFIRIFAPRRGEIVVDADALGLEPPKVRRTDPDRPRAPRRTGPKRKRPAVDLDSEPLGGGAVDAAAIGDGPPGVPPAKPGVASFAQAFAEAGSIDDDDPPPQR